MLPVVREAMALADVVKLSVEELQLLSGLDDMGAGLATLSGPALVLVTRGAAGVVARLGGELLEWVGPKVTPLDTTGAGDAFVAGLLAALAEGELAADAGRAARHPGPGPRLRGARHHRQGGDDGTADPHRTG